MLLHLHMHKLIYTDPNVLTILPTTPCKVSNVLVGTIQAPFCPPNNFRLHPVFWVECTQMTHICAHINTHIHTYIHTLILYKHTPRHTQHMYKHTYITYNHKCMYLHGHEHSVCIHTHKTNILLMQMLHTYQCIHRHILHDCERVS